jgi:hypothetical protein
LHWNTPSAFADNVLLPQAFSVGSRRREEQLAHVSAVFQSPGSSSGVNLSFRITVLGSAIPNSASQQARQGIASMEARNFNDIF